MGGGSNRNSNSRSPFLLKTYEMVGERSTNSVVSWSVSGISFIVWNPLEFSRDMLPKYFKHNNFSSFIRQLNTYGFRKVDPHRWEFANEEFVRGQRHLLKNIHRRKPTHSHAAHPVPLTDEERHEFLNTVEMLQQEKLSLQSELELHKQQNREYEDQLKSLGQTLQNIDQRQTQLMVSLARLLQEPGCTSSTPPMELSRHQHRDKKRRLIALQHLSSSPSSSSLPNLLNMDLVERLDSYVTFWDKFTYEIPSIPSISIDLETGDKSSSSSSGVYASTKQQERDGGAVSSVEENDFFWQQFLTESPDS